MTKDIEREHTKYLAELLKREVIKKVDFEDIVFKSEINAFHSNYLSARFMDNINFGWSSWQAAKAHEAEKLKAVHDSRIQFVEYVNKIENGDYVLVSKQCPDPDFADALFDLLSKKAIGEFGEDQMIYFSDIDEEKIWALMIEAAQEPANDL